MRDSYMVQVIKNVTKVQNKALDGLKPSNSPHRPKKAYTYLKRRLNPEYEGGVKRLPFESCLLTTNGTKKKGSFQAKKGQKDVREVHIKTRPKWYTDLMEWEVDQTSGEMHPKGVYTSDDFKCSNGKKIKALDKLSISKD